MTTSSETIRSHKLSGHQGSVLCLDVSHDDAYILSGSEDKTARLWDVRDEKRRACLCIPTRQEVQSVAFGPRDAYKDNNFNSNSQPGHESSNVFARDFNVYLGIDQFVFEYDLRKATAPIFMQPSKDMSAVLQNQDEVNQISLRYFHHKATKRKGSKGISQKINGGGGGGNLSPSLYVATADDAGTIRVMEATSTKSDVLHHDQNGIAIVPTCVFRPGQQKHLELASGGTDCEIHLWDVTKPKKPISSYTVTPAEDATGDATAASKPQIANPPFVYSLAWSPSGKLLLAGLGNGDSSIFSIENRSLVHVGLLEAGHQSAVASVTFPRFANGNERVVASAGNDGSILVWDVGSNVIGGGEDDPQSNPSSIFATSILRQDDMGTRMDNLMKDRPRVIFGINHGAKPNWVCSSQSPAALYVADTTNDITCYSIPLI